MNTHAELVKLLLETYLKLNQLHAEPGSKCHMLATSIDFIKRHISLLLKGIE